MIPHHAINVGGDWALITPDELLKAALQTPGGAGNKIAISRRAKAQRIGGCRCIHDAQVLRLRNQGCFKMDPGLWSLVLGLWFWFLVLGLQTKRRSWQPVNCKDPIPKTKVQNPCLLQRQSCQPRRRRNGVKAQLPCSEL